MESFERFDVIQIIEEFKKLKKDQIFILAVRRKF